ncbi:MAG: class I SAM-dependent methyltransferase [Chloroflexi bacterium]|nr:class I SAM-dependent methyltransferase [Chloroflexota bacterium]
MDPEQYQIMYDLEATHWWYAGMREITAALLDRYLPQRPGLRILDAGCGTGANLQALERYGSVLGVDISPLALALCRRRGLTGVALASVDHLPFRDAAFDLVTSFDVLYHLAVQEDQSALREFRRVLRPGGMLFLRVPALGFLRAAHDTAVHTRHRYSTAELRRKVAATGFRVVRATYANTLLFPAIAGLRLAQRATGRATDHQGDVHPAAPAVNTALRAALGLEARLLRRVDLPLGVSALCVAQALP